MFKNNNININNNFNTTDSIDIVELNKKLIKKKNSLRTGIKQIYYEYCSNTSLHGVQYLGERRPIKEKFFWVLVFILSIYGCSVLINNIYKKWHETPVIVSFSEKSTPVWNIPFPAVTVCSETKRSIKQEDFSFAYHFGELRNAVKNNHQFDLRDLNDSHLQQFRTLLHICNTQIIEEGVPLLSEEQIDYCDILDSMLPPFERYFLICKWSGRFGACKELFVKTYTEEGICYTFNGLSPLNIYREMTYQYQRYKNLQLIQYGILKNRTLMWSLQDGYNHRSGFKTYPARVLAAGSRAGLFVALQNYIQEVDYSCRGPVQGFKVILHSPDDIPLVSKQYFRIPMGNEILISVKPNMITTSSGIASYNPARRQCFLNSERYLKFFTIYTQGNCELECLANFTLNKCGCVKFSMPRDLHTPVCTEDKISCYDRAEDDLLLKEFHQGLKATTLNFRGETDCNCLPACTSLVYNTEISQGSFDLKEMLAADNDTQFLKEHPGSQMSRLSIYFKENQFITSKRSELYGITDFLANCGGIFGLFMGFSILSMVEMIYHFSLRLWSNMRTVSM